MVGSPQKLDLLIVPLEAGERGEYTEHEFVIASHLADPMYISYGSALAVETQGDLLSIERVLLTYSLAE